MLTTLTIEKGVPMPVGRIGLRTVVEQMGVSNSVLCESAKQASSLVQAGYKLGLGFRRQQEIIDGKVTGKVRVWRSK